MFALKKIVAPFILPPGVFILTIVLVAVLMVYRKRWKLGLVNLTAGLLLWILSIGPVANFLMQGLESDFSIPANPSGGRDHPARGAVSSTRSRT